MPRGDSGTTNDASSDPSSALRSRKRAYDRNRYLKRKERRVAGEASTQVEEDSTSADRGLQSAAGVDRRVGPRRGGTFSSFLANSRGAREDVNVAQPLALLPSTQPRVDGLTSVIVNVNMRSVGACRPDSFSDSAGNTVMCPASNQAF